MPLNLIPAAIGLGVGTVAGLVGSLVVVPLITGRPPTLKGVIAMTTGFAVGGAVTGLTLGLGSSAGLATATAGARIALTAAASTAGGAAGGASQQVTTNLLDGAPIEQGVGHATLTGAAGGLVGGTIAGRFVSPLAGSAIRNTTALGVSAASASASSQMMGNTLDGRPLFENVPEAVLVGTAVGLSAAPVLPAIVRVLPTKPPHPEIQALLQRRPRALENSKPGDHFQRAPNENWVKIGDRWFLRRDVEDGRRWNVRSDPETWDSHGWARWSGELDSILTRNARSEGVESPVHPTLDFLARRRPWALEGSKPDGYFSGRPSERWTKIGDRWVLRGLVDESYQDVRSNPDTWTAYGWNTFGLRGKTQELRAALDAADAAARNPDFVEPVLATPPSRSAGFSRALGRANEAR